MLPYFPRLYPGEVLYSALARFQSLCISNSLRDTFIHVFDDRNMVATVEFQAHLSTLSKNIKIKNKNELLMEHTLFPLYKPFLFKEQQETIAEMMYGDGGMGVKGKIGFLAGGICKKEQLYYCSECVDKDLIEYGNTYLRIIHQMQGVTVCEKHHTGLKPYLIQQNEASRLEFIDINRILLCDNEYVHGTQLQNDISDMFNKIYNGILEEYSAEGLKDLYRRKLKELGYMTVGDNIKYQSLIPELINYFGQELLMEYESELDADYEFSWVRLMLRTKRVKVHPIRHLLLIRFLFGDIEDVVKYAITETRQKLYPCLNPVGGHYKELILSEVDTIVTADYKTREPVITLKCPQCGFEYSRKESDDVFTVGRIKAFGDVWMKELNLIKDDDSLSLRAKARHMGCDPTTIKKYGDIQAQAKKD